MTKTTTDIEKFQYDHIFNLILDIFKFNEKKYGNFVKDTIRILLAVSYTHLRAHET